MSRVATQGATYFSKGASLMRHPNGNLCYVIVNTSTARKRPAVLRGEACQRRRHGKFATNRNCAAVSVCMLHN